MPCQGELKEGGEEKRKEERSRGGGESAQPVSTSDPIAEERQAVCLHCVCTYVDGYLKCPSLLGERKRKCTNENET